MLTVRRRTSQQPAAPAWPGRRPLLERLGFYFEENGCDAEPLAKTFPEESIAFTVML